MTPGDGYGMLVTGLGLVGVVVHLVRRARQTEREACAEWAKDRARSILGPPLSMRSAPPSEADARAFEELMRVAAELACGAHDRGR